MADPFVGEIRAVCFNYAPDGWLLCQGQILNASNFQALYALIGNQYGGQASQGTFGLPDLRGRSIVGVGAGLNLPPVAWGQATGQAEVTLALNQMPYHTHTASVSDPGHNHSAALPAHTHSTSTPANTATSGVINTSSPSNPSYPTTSDGIDANFTNLVNQLNSSGSNLNPLPPTAIYATTANGTMNTGTTGPASPTGASATSSSLTGIGVALSSTGGNTPVSTQSPGLGVYYMIATTGIFPPHP